jgi:predicted acylesterase/phospholipase RssA
MRTRLRFLPLALLILSLPLCADLFQTDARRAPATRRASAAQSPTARATTTPTPQPSPAALQLPDPFVIRVGVVNYNGSEKTHFEYTQTLTEMAQQYRRRIEQQTHGEVSPSISFRIVDGSYDDVLEWYKSGLLNVAIMSPGVVAELLNSPVWGKELPNLYVASEALHRTSPQNRFASPGRRKQKAHFAYNCVCLVRRDSGIRTPEQIKQLADDDKVEFLFVHSLSVSGSILPQYVLKNNYDTDMSNKRIEWTYDHTESLRQLTETMPETLPGESNGDKTVRVAFVKDDTADELFTNPKSQGGKNGQGDDANCVGDICKVPFPEIESDEGVIPQDVVLVNPNFIDYKDKVLIPLFRGYRSQLRKGEGTAEQVYADVPNWVEQYDHVKEWLAKLKLSTNESAQQYFKLKEIIGKLRSSKRNRPGETRLALVLSGGGAKCAYQLGAIQAIEEELDLYKKGDKREVDIDLVVGTSGGAINALCVALGLTAEEGGREKLTETWQNFNQNIFFKPWEPFGVTVGLFIGLFQAILAILSVRLFDPQQINWHRHTGKIAAAMIVFAAVIWFTGLRAWAIIPVILLSIIIGARLFGNPSQEWWKHAGWTMIAVALLETPVALFDWTPWLHMGEYVLLTLMLVQFIVIIIAVRIHNASTTRWWRRAVTIFISLFAAEAALEVYLVQSRGEGYWDWFEQLGKNHIAHHLWLVLTLGVSWTVLALALIGASLLLVGYLKYRGWQPAEYNFIPSERELIPFRRTLLTRLAVALAAIVALQLSLSLFRNDSLSDSAGIDVALAKKIPELLQTEHPEFVPVACERKFLRDPDCSPALKDMSQKIIDNGWLKRDLVITSLRLPEKDGAASVAAANDQTDDCALSARAQDDNDPQNDLYFYFNYRDERERDVQSGKSSNAATLAAVAISSAKPLKKDPRYRPLCNRLYKDKLMDVVIGSTTIFPVFKPRILMADGTTDAPAATLAELIDGGFAHNSPVEAAVLWGATHIILVEASPEEEPQERSDYLLANSIAAFNYLFNQAQLVDAHSRGKVEIFSLRPQGYHPRRLAPDSDASKLAAAANPCAESSLASAGGAPVGLNMCTFDFVEGFVNSAIEQGNLDANSPCFRRERARPIF